MSIQPLLLYAMSCLGAIGLIAIYLASVVIRHDGAKTKAKITDSDNEIQAVPCRKPGFSSSKRKHIRRRLEHRDGDCCYYCGINMCFNPTPCDRQRTIEHLIPSWHETTKDRNSLNNLVLACKSCNTWSGKLCVALDKEFDRVFTSRTDIVVVNPPRYDNGRQVIWQEDGVWNISAFDLPVVVFGDTLEEARRNFGEALQSHFEALKMTGE